MKEIKLTQGKVALVDDDDFEYLNQWKWYAQYSKSADTYYACRQQYNGIGRGNNRNRGQGRKRIFIVMHRVIMDTYNKEIQIDHENHNGLDNRKINLRKSTQSQNSANRKIRVVKSSKFLGVSMYKNKFRAFIRDKGKQTYLGSFNEEIQAANAYNNAAIKIHGEFANLNKIVI